MTVGERCLSSIQIGQNRLMAVAHSVQSDNAKYLVSYTSEFESAPCNCNCLKLLFVVKYEFQTIIQLKKIKVLVFCQIFISMLFKAHCVIFRPKSDKLKDIGNKVLDKKIHVMVTTGRRTNDPTKQQSLNHSSTQNKRLHIPQPKTKPINKVPEIKGSISHGSSNRSVIPKKVVI